MSRVERWAARQWTSVKLAVSALRAWGWRQVLAAVTSSLVVGVVVGVATVLIPNPVFARDIAPVAWNYPVWIVTSVLMGILIATYLLPTRGVEPGDGAVARAGEPVGEGNDEGRSARVGGLAGVLAWFAVGCPVCNKIALVALGYGGALTWFAPFQPVLAVLALTLSVLAVVWRLRGQVACPVPMRRR